MFDNESGAEVIMQGQTCLKHNADWSKSTNTDSTGLFPNEICDSYYYIVNQSCTTLYIGAKLK